MQAPSLPAGGFVRSAWHGRGRNVKAYQQIVPVETRGPGAYDATEAILRVVAESQITVGTCNVFVRHTSASLVIQENADPSVRTDLQRWLERVAPEDRNAYEHDAEGPDDMPAHLRSTITKTSEVIPVRDGTLALGTWQAVYLWEHRRAAHRREIVVTVLGV